jgi:hypothetical protein
MKDANTDRTYQVLLLSRQPDAAERIFADLSATSGASGKTALVQLDGHACRVTVRTGVPDAEDVAWMADIAGADAIAIAIRHLDVLSLDLDRQLLNLMPDDPNKAVSVLLCREDGETDFKLSCPFCGQKLWVRDSDVDKRGRCPNCQKAFTLPSPARHLRAHLQIDETIPILNVYFGNAISTSTIILDMLRGMEEGITESSAALNPAVLKQRTVRVQVQPPGKTSDAESGPDS